MAVGSSEAFCVLRVRFDQDSILYVRFGCPGDDAIADSQCSSQILTLNRLFLDVLGRSDAASLPAARFGRHPPTVQIAHRIGAVVPHDR